MGQTEELDPADFNTKRLLLDKLNFFGELRADDRGHWIEASCAIAPEREYLPIGAGFSREQ